jgi:hypothetical protein
MRLPASSDFPQAVLCAIVSNRHVAAGFKAVRNATRILSVSEPVAEIANSVTCDLH